jgi:DNA-binding MarR family transcriptional regulator
MTSDTKASNLILELWFITHRTRDILRNCGDKVFGESGLTAEQYGVLAVMEVLGSSVRVTDLARGLGRSANSVSMIVDRMVKAGLVRRGRDRGDRRTVRVSISSKGEAAFRPATVAGLELIREIMSPLSYEDKRTFLSLHEVVRQKALHYLNPEEDIEEMRKSDVTNRPDLARRLRQYLSASAGEG